MSLSISTPNSAPDYIVIDYLVDGPRTVSGLVRAQTRLLGMAVVGADGRAHFLVDGIREFLQSLGNCRRIYFDAIFARALEDQFDLPHGEFHDVKIMTRLLGEQLKPSETWHDPISNCTPDVNRLPVSLSQYRIALAINRAQQIWSCFVVGLMDRVLAAQLWNVYHEIELPVVDATIEMIRNGIPVDIEILQGIEQSQQTQAEIAHCQLRAAGYQGSLDAPAAVAKFLFEDLGLPILVRNRDGTPSTAEAVLCRIDSAPAVIGPLRNFRRAKRLAVSARQILSHYDPIANCVRCDLDPVGAVTGRFSCCHPNLQGLSLPLLQAFKAPHGHRFIEADYSQIELRVLAQLSGDQNLREAFENSDVDIHRRTAAVVLDKPENEVTGSERKTFGKAINFAIIYGQAAQSLATKLSVDEVTAQSLIERFYRRHPAVVQWRERVREFACRYGFVTTIYGRRRQIYNLNSQVPGERDQALRQAVNTVVQGSAADLNKFALARLYSHLRHSRKLLLTIHDSFLFMTPQRDVQETVDSVRAILESSPPAGFNVPLPVSMSVGRTWAECQSSPETE